MLGSLEKFFENLLPNVMRSVFTIVTHSNTGFPSLSFGFLLFYTEYPINGFVGEVALRHKFIVFVFAHRCRGLGLSLPLMRSIE
jgi:hypothetical protein